MGKPQITRRRIVLAFAVAVIADALEFPITAAEDLSVGTLLVPAEGANFVLDCVVMATMTKLLGFHWLFLPSFLIELVPEIDVLPTWVGCVAYVLWERRKERPHPSAVNIQAAEVISPPVVPLDSLLPPLLQAETEPITRSLENESDVENRLGKLTKLRDQNLISAGEYEAKRQEILSKL